MGNRPLKSISGTISPKVIFKGDLAQPPVIRNRRPIQEKCKSYMCDKFWYIWPYSLRSFVFLTYFQLCLLYVRHCFIFCIYRQNTEMWRDFNRINDVNQAAVVWLLTLEKQGCSTMLQAGIVCLPTAFSVCITSVLLFYPHYREL